MYNWYPIFSTLASDASFRTQLNDRCYNTFRLLEQGYGWYPISPYDAFDELALVLKGTPEIPVEKVSDWFKTRDKWEFRKDYSDITKNPV